MNNNWIQKTLKYSVIKKDTQFRTSVFPDL